MPIVYSAIVPHSPLLLPTIGKDAYSTLQKTTDALATVRKAIEEKQVETLILLTTSDEHKKHSSLFRILLPTEYTAEFTEFGDLMTTWSCPSDTVLAAEAKNDLARAEIKTTFKSDSLLDYPAGVPLFTLVKEGSLKIIVIQPAEVDLQSLFAFGQILHSTFQSSQKRIACIASGDLAHCGKKKSTHEHYAKTCLPFDYMFLDALQKKRPEPLLSFDYKGSEKLGACALPVTVVLHGMLDQIDWTVSVLSYEAPFGVGYAVVEFLV